MALKRIIIFLFLGSCLLFCEPAHSQTSHIKIVDFDGLSKIIGQQKSDVTVVNFWATWCVPCVVELPYLEELTSKYSDDEIHVVLVSLDFKKSLDEKFYPFLAKHNLQSEVVLLQDKNMNDWIDRVDPSWTGAIPATLIIKGNIKKFHEGKFESLNEIEHLILSIK